MKKRLLLIILFLVSFVASGCTAKYEIYIKDDLSVIESLSAQAPKDEVITSLYYESFDEYLDGLKESSGYDELGGKLETLKLTGQYGANMVTNYKTVNDYVTNSPALQEMFDNITIKEVDNNIYIESNGFYPIGEVTSTRSAIDDLEVSIVSHYAIQGLNGATCKIDKGFNVCNFHIKKTTEDYKLTLTINKVLNSSTMVIMFIIGGIIIIGLFGLFTYGRITKSNEI